MTLEFPCTCRLQQTELVPPGLSPAQLLVVVVPRSSVSLGSASHLSRLYRSIATFLSESRACSEARLLIRHDSTHTPNAPKTPNRARNKRKTRPIEDFCAYCARVSGFQNSRGCVMQGQDRALGPSTRFGDGPPRVYARGRRECSDDA